MSGKCDGQVQGFAALSDANKDAIILCTSPEVRAKAVADGYHNKSSSPLVKIEEYGAFGQATFATQPIACGSTFFRVTGLVLPFPTVYTIMLGDDHHHLLFADGAQCLAHSCDPNVQVCILPEQNALYCKALRNIDANELISFNYNTTEWDMSTPFRFSCHSPLCAGEIRGFKHLSMLRRQVLLSSVTEAICSLSGWMPVHTFELPATLSTTSNENETLCNVSYLQTACPVQRGTVLLSFFPLEIQKDHIVIGGKYAVPHDAVHFNCVYVEGRLIACKTLMTNDKLRINMNFCIYDIANYLLQDANFNNINVQNTETLNTRKECVSQLCTGFKYMSEALKQQYLYLCEPDVRATAMHDGWIVKSSQSLLRVMPNGMMGQTAFATTDIPPHVTLFHCTGLVVPFPTMYTICIGKDQHLLFGDAAECIAHHCDPNVRVVVNATNNVNTNVSNDDDDDDDDRHSQSFDFVTIKPIKAGELITFNYNSTEWVMNSPFTCMCQSPVCAKVIQGFKHLSTADQERLWDITSDYVKSECALNKTKQTI